MKFSSAIILLLLGTMTNEPTTVLAKTQAEKNAEEALAKAQEDLRKAQMDGSEDWGDEEDDFIHGNTRFDDSEWRDGDDDFEKPKKIYDNNEKEKWIYGTPGTDDYKPDLTDDEIAEMEIMWEYDFALAIVRGLIQGLARGFYKTYRYNLNEECFGKDAVLYIYYIVEGFQTLEFEPIMQSAGLIYNTWYMIEYECEFLDHIYDVSQFCFDHDCNPEQLLQNEMSKVFQVTGALNAMAAIYYDTMPEDDQHTGWFDMYSEVGLNIGKLLRYTLGFDPKEVHDN